MKFCYLGLGSNLGDREQNLRKAVELLNANKEINLLKISSIYAAKPVGYLEQPDFLNIVVQAETTLSPADLLAACWSIEGQLKRIRTYHWGPRTIDVDILLYDDLRINTPQLAIPHPLMEQRLFVLIPLAEISPQLCLHGRTIQERISEIGDQEIFIYKPW